MWSITLIVLVAVALSVVMLVTGITLAVTIERHRHHKILRQHGIQVESGLRRRFQIATTSTDSPTSIRSDARLPSDEAQWGEHKSTECLHTGTMRAMSDIPRQHHISIQRIVSPTRHPQSTRIQKRAKLRKRVPLVIPTSSPLSVITELTDSPCSPAAARDIGSKEQRVRMPRGRITPVPWRLPTRRITQDQNVVLETPISIKPDTDQSKQEPFRFPVIDRSVITTNVTSIPPSEPLPPLPTSHTRNNSRVQDRTSSSGTIETIDSSVLGSISSHAAQKTSQDLEEFDFGLGIPTVQIESPARTLRQGCWDGRDAVNSLRASLNPSSTVGTEDSGSSFEYRLPGIDRSLDLKNRHSMIEVYAFRNQPMRHAHTKSDAEDPFTTAAYPRPASVGCRPMHSSSYLRASTRSSGTWPNSPSRQGHKRQNCVRISGNPILQPKKNQQSHMPRVTEEQENIIAKTNTSSADGDLNHGESPWPQPLTIRRSIMEKNPVGNNLLSYTADSCSNHSGLSQYLSTAKTPSRNPPSPTRFDSPILPSPAYHSSRLFIRKSKVQGPRSPPSRIPLAQRRLFTSDPRKAKMLLESLNSEAEISPAIFIGKDSDEGTQIGAESIHRSISESQSSFGSSSSLSSSYSGFQREGGTSQSVTSIWEDASIDGDSPEPEMPTPTKRILAVNTHSVHRPFTIPKDVLDYGAMENIARKEEAMKDTANAKNVENVGLGLTFSTTDKPPSLYDREGFLK